MDPAVRDQIQAFLRLRGLRRTVQRDAIIEAAFGTREHFTAEDLLDLARKRERSVSRATVYRTLPLLVESGLLRELDLGRDQQYYDPNFIQHPNHNHLICLDCDRIVEFEDLHMELLENCISKRLGFTPSVKMIRIEATCEQLRTSGTCPNKKPSKSTPRRRATAGHLS